MIDRRQLRSQLLAVVLMSLVTATMQACSSTGGSDAGSGIGGFTGNDGAGGNTPDAARDALLDAAPPGTPFICSDGILTCKIGETYCREIAGQLMPDGGQYPSRAECAPFKDNCSPHDCSCIIANPGNIYCFACTQLPSGAVVAQCGPV